MFVLCESSRDHFCGVGGCFIYECCDGICLVIMIVRDGSMINFDCVVMSFYCEEWCVREKQCKCVECAVC